MATNNQLKDKRDIPSEQFQQVKKFFTSAELCVVCQDQPRDRVILPCAHFCICHFCAEGLTRCPYKNLEINRNMWTHYSQNHLCLFINNS